RRELLHRTKSPAAVVELPGGLIELEVVVGKLLFDLEFTVPVDLQALEHLLPYIEGSDAETGQHPLVRPRADGIHTRRLYIQLDGPEALDDVRVQDGAMRVGQVGEGTQVMAKSVQVGHPRHRHDAGPAVDEGLEVLHTDGAVAISRDSELDSLLDDVLPLSRREQQADLVWARIHELGELALQLAVATEQLSDLQWTLRLVLEELGTRLHHGPRHGRDVLRVEVGPLCCDGEIAPDAQGIAWVAHMNLRSGECGGRRRDEGPAVHHWPFTVT